MKSPTDMATTMRSAASPCNWAPKPTPCCRVNSGRYDACDRKRFEKETGKTSPGGRQVTATDFGRAIATSCMAQWRARILAQFHRDMLEDLQARRPDARLYLVGGDMFTNPGLQPMLQPTIPNRLRVDEVMLQMGIVAGAIRRPEADRLFPTRTHGPSHTAGQTSGQHQSRHQFGGRSCVCRIPAGRQSVLSRATDALPALV